MPKQERFRTQYPGVYYINGIGRDGKIERIYYYAFRKQGQQCEEKAGRQREDSMTAAKASRIRGERIEEKRLSRKSIREAAAAKPTILNLWARYKPNKPNLKGIVTDENRFKNYIGPIFGKKTPDQVTSELVDNFREDLLKKRTPATVRNVLELLRRIINFGVKKNISPPLPFTIEMPPVDNEQTEDLTAEQFSTLWEAIEKDYHPHAGNMMKLALFSGMRRGELFRLKWKDIDFDASFITLRDPKGSKDQKIPLNDDARAVLESQDRTKSEYVFPGKKGEMRTDIKRPVNRIKKAAGLPPDFRALHGLRHVYASMMASSGQVDMFTLQKLLTHKSQAMTQRYAHLRDKALQDAGKLAGQIVMKQVEEGTNQRKKEAEKIDHKTNVIPFPKGKNSSKAYKSTTG